ncbi:MAG: flippase-like domain-containing protein [Bacteroidales bacterium]|nr:flippase-like domain-containing protein [Bacteroidales bacterium]
MNNTIKKVLNYSLFFALAIILLYFAFRKVDVNIIITGFKDANYIWVIFSILVAIFANLVRALRWQLLIEPLGVKPSIKNVFGAVMIGYLANFAFPRLGEITKCGVLKKTDNVSFESLIGTVLVERASDLVMLLFCVVLVFFIKIDFFGEFLLHKIFKPLFFKASGFSFMSIIIIASFLLFIYLLLHLIRKNVFGHKVKARVKSMYYGIVDGLKSVSGMKRRGLFIFYSFLIWSLYLLMTWLLVFSTKPTSDLSLVDSLFVMVVGSFGMIVPVQGGFGAFHIITATGLGLFGISREDGLVFATIAHESQTILLIVLGTISMAILFIKKKTKPTNP